MRRKLTSSIALICAALGSAADAAAEQQIVWDSATISQEAVNRAIIRTCGTKKFASSFDASSKAYIAGTNEPQRAHAIEVEVEAQVARYGKIRLDPHAPACNGTESVQLAMDIMKERREALRNQSVAAAPPPAQTYSQESLTVRSTASPGERADADRQSNCKPNSLSYSNINGWAGYSSGICN